MQGLIKICIISMSLRSQTIFRLTQKLIEPKSFDEQKHITMIRLKLAKRFLLISKKRNVLILQC